jgi:hypothetical protein
VLPAPPLAIEEQQPDTEERPARPKRKRRDTERMEQFKKTLAKRPKTGEKKKPQRIRRVPEKCKKSQTKKLRQPKRKTTASTKARKKNPCMQPGSPDGGGHRGVEPGEPVPLQVHEVIIGTEGGGCSFTFADLDGNKVDNGRAHTLDELDFEREYQETVVDHCTDHRISFAPKITDAHKWLKIDDPISPAT